MRRFRRTSSTVRQWVLSLPITLRLLPAAQPELVTPMPGVVQRVLERRLLDAAGLVGDEGQGGAVTLIQRFGSAANLNVHLHCLVLYGVYCSGADGVPECIEVAAPTEEGLHALLQTVIARLMKLLTRWGVLLEDDAQSYLAESDSDAEEARTLRPLQAEAVTYRIAFGPHAGRKVLTPRGAMPREAAARQPLCADIDGFSLHAAVRIEAHDRKRRAALVPRPVLHLIPYHGMLALDAKLRPVVVLHEPADRGPVTDAAGEIRDDAQFVQARAQHIGWARLLERLFDIDLRRCPNCGAGELKIIAATLRRAAIEKILTPLESDPRPPPRARASEAGHAGHAGHAFAAVREARAIRGARHGLAHKRCNVTCVYAEIAPWSIALSFAVAAVMGVIFRFHPARKASFLEPIEALRYQ